MTKIKTITEIKTKPNIITIIKTITKTTNMIKNKTKTKTTTNTMINIIIKTVTNIITTTDIKTMARSKTKTKTKMPIRINFIDIFDIFIETTQTKTKQNLTLIQLLILREANKKIKEKSDIIQPYTEAKYSTYGCMYYNTTEGENKFHKKNLKEIEKSHDMFRHFKIISLDIDDRREHNLEYINSIINLISNLISNQQNLIRINLSGFQFLNKFKKIVNLLPQCQFLNNLILSDVISSNYEFTKLANVLIQCPVLTHLDINSCGIEFESLSKEDISENIEILTGAIPQCKMLTNLIFCNNKLGPRGLLKFASMFSQCTNITSLDISENNDLNVIEDLVSFIGVTSFSTSLVHINLMSNGIGRLGQVFSECSSLTSLYLSCNDICTTDIEETEDLQQVFKQCTKLVTLDLEYNEINDKEFINLSKVLSHCTSLKELDISANKITNNASLPLCTQLNYLNISLNNFDYNEIANIGEVLSQYKALTNLNLSNIKLSDNGLISFSKTLPEYRLLKKLDLSNNGISSIGIISLVSVLSQCKLKKINLSGNNIDESELVCLKQSAKLNNINLMYEIKYTSFFIYI